VAAPPPPSWFAMVKALDARAVDNGSGGFLDLANADAAFA
jgi:hypothetical protein